MESGIGSEIDSMDVGEAVRGGVVSFLILIILELCCRWYGFSSISYSISYIVMYILG